MGSPRLHLTLLGLSLCALKITVHFIIHPPPPPPSPNLHGSAYFPLKPTVFSWFPLLIIVYRVQKFAYIRIILLKLCYFFRWQVREREKILSFLFRLFSTISLHFNVSDDDDDEPLLFDLIFLHYILFTNYSHIFYSAIVQSLIHSPSSLMHFLIYFLPKPELPSWVQWNSQNILLILYVYSSVKNVHFFSHTHHMILFGEERYIWIKISSLKIDSFHLSGFHLTPHVQANVLFYVGTT